MALTLSVQIYLNLLFSADGSRMELAISNPSGALIAQGMQDNLGVLHSVLQIDVSWLWAGRHRQEKPPTKSDLPPESLGFSRSSGME